MGLFNKKPKFLTLEFALFQANNVFKNIILPTEIIKHAINGKCDSENLAFAIGVFAITDDRLLYYFQDESSSGSETISFSNIEAVSVISGSDAKMGKYVGLQVELYLGKRTVKCVYSREQQRLVKDFKMLLELKISERKSLNY